MGQRGGSKGGGGGGGYKGVTITTKKGLSLQNSDGLLDQLVGIIFQETLRYSSEIGPMAGWVTPPRASALALYGSEQPEMLFGFYGGGDVVMALAAGYANLAFIVFSQCPLLLLLGSLESLYSSASTGTGKYDDSVDLGLA